VTDLRDQSPSTWMQRLAGLGLVIDGIGSLFLSATLLMMSVLPRPSAVQGRAPVDDTQFGWTLALFVFAIACFWAGQRAVRQVRAGRLVGIVLGGVVVAFVGVLAFTSPSMDLGGIAFLVVLAVAHALIVLALARWPADESRGPIAEAAGSSHA